MPCPPTRNRGEMLVGAFTRFVLSSPCFVTTMSSALAQHLPGRTARWCWGRALGVAAASPPFLPAKAPLWAQHHREGMARGTQPAHITLSLVYLVGPKSVSVPGARPAPCVAGWGSILQGPGSHLLLRIRHKSTTDDRWADLEELSSMQALPPPPSVCQGSDFGLPASMLGRRCSKGASAQSLPSAGRRRVPAAASAPRGHVRRGCWGLPRSASGLQELSAVPSRM